MSAREYFVYRLYNKQGTLLYVGCTKNLRSRWTHHRNQRPGLKLDTARCRVAGPYTRAVALRIERDAAVAEMPLLGHIPGIEQSPARLAAEHLYRELPVKDKPVRGWYSFRARPLVGFNGWWRCFSEGRPTALLHEDQMDDWEDLVSA